MNRDLDVSRFLVGTGGVVPVLPHPMVSVCRHAFEQHAALQAQDNHDPLGISQTHIVNTTQCSLRECIRTTPPDSVVSIVWTESLIRKNDWNSLVFQYRYAYLFMFISRKNAASFFIPVSWHISIKTSCIKSFVFLFRNFTNKVILRKY